MLVVVFKVFFTGISTKTNKCYNHYVTFFFIANGTCKTSKSDKGVPKAINSNGHDGNYYS